MRDDAGTQAFLRFLVGLSSAMAAKDLEAMWPVGVLSTAAGFGGAAAAIFEEVLARRIREADDARSSFDYMATFPTSYPVSLSFFTIGAISDGWDTERLIALGGSYLQFAQRTKFGDLFNADGRNVLFLAEQTEASWRCLEGATGPTDPQKAATNRLSALSLAAAESTYFQFHRIATEKHGPYGLSGREGSLLFRSSMNRMPPIELWPELEQVKRAPRGNTFDLAWHMRSAEFHFDAYSNLSHNHNSVTDTLRMAIRSDGEWQSICASSDLATTRISELATELEQILRAAIAVIPTLGRSELQRRLIGCLFFANRDLLASSRLSWQDAWNFAVATANSRGRAGLVAPDRRAIAHSLRSLIEELHEQLK